MRTLGLMTFILLISNPLMSKDRYDRIQLNSIFINDLSSREKITFVAFGDGGTGPNDKYQYAVAKKMLEVCKQYQCDFGLMLGDSFNQGDYSYDGVLSSFDPKFKEMFEVPYGDFKQINQNFHFWPVLGNHDYPDEEENFLIAVNGQINYTKRNTLWRMPYSYYNIPKLPQWVDIFAFDTELLTEDMGKSPISGDPIQEDAAREFLCSKERKGWKLVTGHHPFLTFGPRGEGNSGNINDMDAMAKFVHPILKDCDVDIYFSGHDHLQEHIVTKDYDLIVQGAGAETNPLWSFILDNYYEPGMKPIYFSNLFKSQDSYVVKYAKGFELGFSIVQVTRNFLELKFFNVDRDRTSVKEIYRYRKLKN